jgi:hypothetical protein
MAKKKDMARIADLQITSRSFAPEVSTYDEKTRSIEGVLSTEAPVAVWDWNRYEVVNEVLLMDGMTHSEQIPLLDSHNRASVKDQLGSIKNIRVDSGRLLGRLFFASTTDAEDALTKAREGHLTDISIGYTPQNVYVPAGETYTHTDGRSFVGPVNVSLKTVVREGSLTPIGADSYAKLRSEQQTNNIQSEVESLRAENDSLKKSNESLMKTLKLVTLT